MKKVDVRKYEEFCCAACMQQGFPEDVARETARLLVRTDRFGIFTHGTYGLRKYLHKVPAGGMDPDARPEIVREGPGFAVIDGHNGMPMYTAIQGIRTGMEKASRTGTAYIGIRGSGHCGACGVYAVEAAEKGFFAIFASVSSNCMSVPGGKGKSIGNSPFAYAFPNTHGDPVFMDIAMSQVAGTKIRMAREAGKPIPPGWIVDSEGRPTTDYFSPYSFVPMAGHKGYCLSFMVEGLAAILSGGAILSAQKLWSVPEAVPEFSHFCIVIDVDKVIGLESFSGRIEAAGRELHESPKAAGSDRIWLPGEMEWQRCKKSENGLELPDDVYAEMERLAEETGLDLAACLTE